LISKFFFNKKWSNITKKVNGDNKKRTDGVNNRI
jgi:hypothetical protein